MADLPAGAADLQALTDGGYSAAEIGAYKQRTTEQLLHGGFKPQEIESYWGDHPPDDSKLKSYIKGNIGALSVDDKAKLAENPLDIFRAGLQHGATSLALSGPPELKAPADTGLGGRILYGAGQMINELPEMAAGFVGGTAAGTAAGGAIGGAAGAPFAGVGAAPGAAIGGTIGGVVGGGAGANALPTAMREILTDYYAHKGASPPTWNDVWDRASTITLDTLKAGAVGAVTNVAGLGAGRVVGTAGGGRIAQGVANVTTGAGVATAAGAALEGQVPTLNDFVTGAALAVGMWGSGEAMGHFTGAHGRFVPSKDTIEVAQNQRDIYVKTGLSPKDMMEHAMTDPALQQEILAPRAADGTVITPGLKALAPPEPPPFKPETQIQPPEIRRPEIAFGDSLAVGTIRHGGMIGTEAPFRGGEELPGNSRVGATTSEVLRRINNSTPEDVQGKDVLLSTGASNSPGKLDLIPQQIEALKEKGARSITIMGVGTHESLSGVNDALQKIADDAGGSVRFIGPLKHVAADGIHSTNYRDEIAGSVAPPKATPAPPQAATAPATPAGPSAAPEGIEPSTAPPAPPQKPTPAPVDLSKYATGNAVPGGPSSVSGVHPEFASRIENMVQAMPPEIRAKFQITSGFRDAEREAQVYAEQHPGQPVPEDSYHSHGMAIDTTKDPAVIRWINANGDKFGVGFTIKDQPGEQNHLEPTENGQRIPHGQVAEWAAGNGKITTAPRQKLGTLVAPTPDSVTDDHLSLFRTLEGNRDGGNDHAISPAGAIGRNQIMPDTAKAYGFDPSRLQDVDYNDMVARHIISDLSVKFEGNLADILVGYNAGPGRARMWIAGGRRIEDLPLETQRYLEHAEQLGALNEGYIAKGQARTLAIQGDNGEWAPPNGTQMVAGGGRGVGPPEEPPIPPTGVGGGPEMLPPPRGRPFDLNADMLRDQMFDIIGDRDERSRPDWLDARRMVHEFDAQLTPFRRIDRAAQEAGILRPEDATAEDMFRQTYGSSGRAQYFIRWGILDPITFNQKNDASIINAFHAVKNDGGNTQDFVAYLLAKRTLEKRDQGIETGIDPDLAQSWLDKRLQEDNGTDRYERGAMVWRQVMDGVVDYARDSGLFTPAQADAMKALNRDYVTFRRIMDPEYEPPRPPGRSFMVRRARKMEGSSRQIDNPITATLDNIHTMVAMADRNRAIGHVINEVNGKLPPEQALFTHVQTYEPPPRRPSNWDVRDENGVPLHTEWFQQDENGNYIPINVDADPAVSLASTYRSNGRGVGGNDFIYFNDGRMEVWHTKDADLADAMRMPWPGKVNPIAQFAISVAQLARSGITSQLSFPFRALWHGQMASTVLSRTTNWVPFHDLMEGGVGAVLGKDGGDAYRRWVANGGADAAISSIDTNYVQRDIDRIWKDTGSESAVWNFAQHPIEALQAFHHAVDATARIGHFLRSEAEGVDSMKAAMNARMAYLDHGEPLAASWLQTWTRYVPFATVGWKDFQQFNRALTDRPVGTLTKAYMMLTLPTILNYAANMAADQFLDDKDKYINQPAWERDLYWILPPMPYTGWRFKIPRPYNVGWTFSTLPEHFLDAMFQEDSDKFTKLAESLMRQVVPPFIPSVLVPPIEQTFNYNLLTGRSMMNHTLEQASGPMRYNPDTTETAKALARAIGAGPTMMPGANPIMSEEWLKGWAGPAPYWALRALEAPFKSGGRPWEIADVPFAGAFFTRQPHGTAQVISDFYSTAKQFEADHADLELAIKHANPDEIGNAATARAGTYSNVEQAKQVLSNLYSVITVIDQDKTMTSDEKRKQIDGLTEAMVAQAKIGLEVMRSVNKAIATPAAPAAASQ